MLTVGINWKPIEERIASLRNREIILSVISLVVIAFFLIRWLSRNITQPILKVTEFAEEVSRGNLNATLDLGEKAQCWEIEGCDKTDCPAYGETSVRCWYTDDTLCKGEPSGAFPDKLGDCRKCPVYNKNVGDEIAQLGDSLTHMLKNMRAMYEKISSFSKDLELQVAKRTEELEQKTAELEKANIQLKKLDELKSTFLANMSHELRTPLNSILGYTDLLLDGVDGDITEEQEKSLTKVHRNAKHLLKLINDVLDISRIESGRMELDLKPVDVKDLIGETISALDPLIDRKGLALETVFDEGLPFAHADPDRVRQVVTNLVDNAIKFTSEGRITVRARASEMGLEKDKRPKFVEVCISDTGIGIMKRDLNKLFDKFRPLDTLATSQYKGAGLGLSICKGLIEMQEGEIWVKSKYGKGSTFCFTLPVEAEAAREEAGIVEELKLSKVAAETRVLVVDDEPDQVTLISKILREEGYQIAKAYDGQEAIESVKRSQPDLIILDLMMPNGNGFDVIEYLKGSEETNEIPIIVLTGKELTRKQTQDLNGKVERIMKKGILSMEEILEGVKSTLETFQVAYTRSSYER